MTVSSILALRHADFVGTVSRQTSSINIWLTRAGLTRVHQINFKLQSCVDPRESLKRAQLHFLSYKLQETEVEGVKIYLKSSRVERQKASFSLPASSQGPPKADGELMQALFDESAVVAEACGEEDSASSINSLQELEDQEQADSDDELPLHFADIFAVNEAAETLGQTKEDSFKFQAAKKVLLEAEQEFTKPKEKAFAKKKSNLEEPEAKPVEPNKEFLN